MPGESVVWAREEVRASFVPQLGGRSVVAGVSGFDMAEIPVGMDVCCMVKVPSGQQALGELAQQLVHGGQMVCGNPWALE